MAYSIQHSAQSAFEAFYAFASRLGSMGSARELFWTAAVLCVASLGARIQYRRIDSRAEETIERRRQARANFRNGLILATLIVLGFVWGGEIRSLILSLAAIAAAIMIVSKEVISCFYGAFVFALLKPAKIGDSVEVNGRKGELIDHNWLFLTLLEHDDCGEPLGRSVKIPISALLSCPISNLSQEAPYLLCSLAIHAPQSRASDALDCALRAASSACSAWLRPPEHARDGSDASPPAAPSASFSSVDKDTVAVCLRFPAPARRRSEVCSAVSRAYFLEFERRLARPSSPPPLPDHASPTAGAAA